MTDVFVNYTDLLQGEIEIPPSKSHTQRAILMAAMCEGISEVKNYLSSPDIEAMINGCAFMGAKILTQKNTLLIEGCAATIRSDGEIIDAKNSGQVFRFLTAMLCLGEGTFTITGDESLEKSRPISPLVSALRELGAHCEYTKNSSQIPLEVRGPIQCGKAYLSGEDSQPVSALLMATSFLEGTSEIFVSHPGEKPWIDLTLYWLEKMGVEFENYNYDRYLIQGKPIKKAFSYTVGGDFSSALFPIAAALITHSDITLRGLDFTDVQGDRKVIDLLIQMGAKIEIDQNLGSLRVFPSGELTGRDIDINLYIDALPLLAVIGCFANGETRIYNGEIARKKESDRITTICNELKKMGADIEENADGVTVRNSKLRGANVEGCKDHRLVMSLAVAALGAQGKTTITDSEYVQKSFPQFFKKLKNLGALIV